jgi:hypothetical protein
VSSRTSRPEDGLFANEEESIYGRSDGLSRRANLLVERMISNEFLERTCHLHRTLAS